MWHKIHSYFISWPFYRLFVLSITHVPTLSDYVIPMQLQVNPRDFQQKQQVAYFNKGYPLNCGR